MKENYVRWIALKSTYTIPSLLQICREDFSQSLGVIPLVDDDGIFFLDSNCIIRKSYLTHINLDNGHIMGYMQLTQLEEALIRQEKLISTNVVATIVPTMKQPHQLCLDFGTSSTEYPNLHCIPHCFIDYQNFVGLLPNYFSYGEHTVH